MKTTKRILLSLVFLLLTGFLLQAQVARQTGVIRGVVVDAEGNPVPGMSITATSPALMGKAKDVTDEDGSFRLPSLPPGVYTITAELQGFKTIKRENVVVRVGMVVTLRLTTSMATLEEEVVVVAEAPTVDVQSSKIANIISSDMLERLPLNRNFIDIFNTVPGAVGAIDTYSGSIHGATPTTVTYELDGVNANSPTHGGPIVYPHYDAMEEVEIATGGLPAQVGNTGGTYVNIVTKSGGNEFHGHIQLYYTNESFTNILFPEEQLTAMGIGKPESPIYDWDVSGTLGGPIIKDKIWFFSDLGLLTSKRHGRFIPATILGKRYDQFDLPETTWRGMFKLTFQISESLKLFTMLHGEVLDRDVYNFWHTKRTYDSRFVLDNNTRIAATGNLTWIIGSDSFVDFRVGYVNRWYPIVTDPQYDANECYIDSYTGYTWNGIPTWKSKISRQTKQASARLTHFQDDFLGGDHEIGLGIEYVWGLDRYGYERTNPLTWFFYNGNPYYYRSYYGLNGPHPVFGDGRLRYTNCGKNPHDSEKDLIVNRLGTYIQDAFTIRNRLTINAGLRVDYYNGYMGKAVSTGTTGLPFEIGQAVVEPVLGFNPFGPIELEPIKDVMAFTMLSPRIGFSYDLFGDGKTALKLAYSRYAEQVPVWRFSSVSPDILAQYTFDWWDLNQNGQPDSPGIDKYQPTGGFGQFSRPDPNWLKSRVDPDLHAPYYDEIVASIDHELLRNFSIKIQYLYKRGKDMHGWGLYDKETGRFWYNLENAPEWWVPFTTIVPAYGEFPEKEVTVYFFSQNSPYNNRFWRQTNIPESKREYHALELSFDKRFADGWSLGGSVVLSQHKSFNAGDSPNDFINGFGRDNWDQPLAIKLFGTFDLPFGFVGSFFYRHTSGSPYGRTVTVAPPLDWTESHNAVPWTAWARVEENGTRRNQSYDMMDIRFEKQFRLPLGRLSFFLDLYNLMGNRYVYVGMDPGGVWNPVAENTNIGTYTPGWNYGRLQSIEGTRIFKFSIRFVF